MKKWLLNGVLPPYGHRGLVDKSVALSTTSDHGFESWSSRLDLGLNYRPGDLVIVCKVTTGWDGSY